MSKATKAHASFPQFAKLPPELRMLVWKCTLPSIGPAIYPYRTGLWDTRLIDEGDPRFNVMNHNLEMFHRHEYLRNGAHIKVPTLLVNYESHAVARAWLRGQHYQLFRDRDRAPEATGDPRHWTFRRLFDPDLDIVYVAPERLIDFLSEEENRTMDEDLIHINPLSSSWNYRTAFDYRVLVDSEVAFDDLVRGRRHDIESFFVIMQNSPRRVDVASSGWWDLEPYYKGHYFYYDMDRARIRLKSDYRSGDKEKTTEGERQRWERLCKLRETLDQLSWTLKTRFGHTHGSNHEMNVGQMHSRSGCAKHYVFRPVRAVKR